MAQGGGGLKKRRGMLTRDVLLLFDNSYAHTRFTMIWLRGCEEEERNVDLGRSVLI